MIQCLAFIASGIENALIICSQAFPTLPLDTEIAYLESSVLLNPSAYFCPRFLSQGMNVAPVGNAFGFCN